jgi:hypothetical protein
MEVPLSDRSIPPTLLIHMIYHNQLLIDGGLDFKRLLTEKEGVSKLARWWIRSGRINQFRLANELIK